MPRGKRRDARTINTNIWNENVKNNMGETKKYQTTLKIPHTHLQDKNPI